MIPFSQRISSKNKSKQNLKIVLENIFLRSDKGFVRLRRCKGKYFKPSWDFLGIEKQCWTSLVVQWAGIRLSVQGTRVQSLVREDSTGHRAGVSQLLSPHAAATEALTLSRLCSTREDTAMRSPGTTTNSSPHSLQLEKVHVQQRRPSAKINKDPSQK